MSEGPINLNHVRKTRARAAAKQAADANAVKHGRTKAERTTDVARKTLADKQLDGHQKTDD